MLSLFRVLDLNFRCVVLVAAAAVVVVTVVADVGSDIIEKVLRAVKRKIKRASLNEVNRQPPSPDQQRPAAAPSS